jgi:hypothetical protein
MFVQPEVWPPQVVGSVVAVVVEGAAVVAGFKHVIDVSEVDTIAVSVVL